ncbi:MAG: HNH endonuclease [Lachnospiraceae bacterium]|nr:HNH endonuclease [Lachnospiraceae bacterium]
MNEEWRYISEKSVSNIDIFRYKINNFGLVYDTKNDKYPSIFVDDEGYQRVNLNTSNGFKHAYIHRLVKIEFDGFDIDPNKNQVDHKDCIKSHNYPSNLEWVTKEENALRAIDNGLYHQFNIVITEEDAITICKMLKSGLYSYKDISNHFYDKYQQDIIGIVGKIYRGERWKHVSKNYMPFPTPKKEKSIPKSSLFSEEIVHDICRNLEMGHGITKTARYIENKYSISADLENAIGFIKRGKTWKNISCNYNINGNKENSQMSKNPKMVPNETNFEESIRSYGSKIEHIESFVEAVRRFPGKTHCADDTAGHDRNVMR